MEPWLPSFADGALSLPAIEGFGSLLLRDREENPNGWIRFVVEIASLGPGDNTVRAARTMWHWCDYGPDLGELWSTAACTLVDATGSVSSQSFEHEARFQVVFDGTSSFFLDVSIGPGAGLAPGHPSVSAAVRVKVDKGQVGRIGEWWRKFFRVARSGEVA